MKVFKKGILTFVLILTLVLAACSGSNQSSTSSNSNDNTSSNTNGNEPSQAQTAQGITDTEILVGHLGPQSGNTAIYDEIRVGIETYFNYVNENGGVHGRQLKLIAYDDQYQPAKTVQLAKKLVEEDKVFGLVANACTACNMAAKDYYIEKGIPYVMVGTGSKAFVDPPVKNLLGLLVMNYEVEAKIFLDYTANKLGAKRIALVYQNDDFGKTGYNALKSVLDKYPDVEIVAEETFLATDTEFSSQAQKLTEADPEVIITFATPNPAANLKKAIHKIGLTEPTYIVSSVGANDVSSYELAGADVWEGTVSSNIFGQPDPETANEQMKLYLEVMNKEKPDKISTNSIGGWAAAQVFVEGLKRTEGDLTWDNFLQSFYTFDNWSDSLYSGVTFTEDNHYGVTSMFMIEAKDGKLIQTTDTISFDPGTGEVTYE